MNVRGPGKVEFSIGPVNEKPSWIWRLLQHPLMNGTGLILNSFMAGACVWRQWFMVPVFGLLAIYFAIRTIVMLNQR